MNPIYTFGHSTRTTRQVIKLLKAHGIQVVIDVRKLPGSRRYPRFNQDRLKASLKKAGIGYRHIKELGGRRRALPESPNTAWRNRSFQAYADHMLSDEFERGLAKVLKLAETRTVAIMCAEAVPWRCHRSLIADALVARGLRTFDIFTETRAQEHTLKPWARRRGGKVIYPGASQAAALGK